MKIRVCFWSCSLLLIGGILSNNLTLFLTATQTPNQKPDKTEKISYSKDIQPMMAKYCTKCHGGERPRGELALDTFKNDKDALADKELWQKVARVIRSGEMPPENKAKPSLKDQDKLLEWIDLEVNKVDCNLPPDPGQVTIRRLNKSEYNNTIRDLTGVDFQPADDFPDDDIGEGFDNIGDVLTLSPLLIEKYLAAADQIVEKTFADERLRKKIINVVPFEAKNEVLRKKALMVAGKSILRDFGSRVYRRPITEEETERLIRFVYLADKKGDSFDVGIKLAIKAMLVSPHFLFRVEEVHPIIKGKNGHPINDFELANRLSYFLWSSMPDATLFDLAKRGQLRKSDVLRKQVDRMLADPKADALVKNFAGQWLQLRKLREMTPDPDVFPKFNEALRNDMIRETELFFEEIMRENRSIMEFLDADYTIVNDRLAKHYGLKNVTGTKFRKVSWPDARRGGVLTQASVLTVTSNPTRTSPVSRGKWVLENIFNAPPPPPAPDAGELSEDKKVIESAPLRKRLEMHRANPSCATCHERMDPLGFGLENFDGIGSWRDKDGKFPIDASGTLPGGKTFNGPEELRKILLKTKAAEFRKCFAEKMLTYSLGRGLTYQDRCVVDDLCDTLAKNDNRFVSLVHAIVQSDPFLLRRGKKGAQ